MTFLDYDNLQSASVNTDPYPFMVARNVVTAEKLADVLADFPEVPGAGSHPLGALKIKGAFQGLLDEMNEPTFRQVIEQKFDIDLTDRPTMFTVRGFCSPKDGKIHTDSVTKLITVLLYLNVDFDNDGGLLRILRSGTDLDDYVAEVPPDAGTLLVFKRGEKSWHGHKPFEGQRRAIQMNWVTSDDVVTREQRRHRLSSFLKRLRLAPAA